MEFCEFIPFQINILLDMIPKWLCMFFVILMLNSNPLSNINGKQSGITVLFGILI